MHEKHMDYKYKLFSREEEKGKASMIDYCEKYEHEILLASDVRCELNELSLHMDGIFTSFWVMQQKLNQLTYPKLPTIRTYAL